MSDEENFEVARDSDIDEEQTKGKYARPKTAKDQKRRRINRQIHAELKQEGTKRAGPPEASLRLEHVFGYRGYDSRNNVHFSKSGEVLYHVAAVAISQHPDTGVQKFYIGHTDDILSLALHPDKTLAATGQVGKQPTIHIWDTQTMESVGALKGQHSAGVCALAFSGDGRKLASVGLDENHTVVVWDWGKQQVIAQTRGHKDKVFAVAFDPKNDEKLVIVGIKHIKFLTQKDKGFSASRGVFGSIGKPETMLCVEFGEEAGSCFTGAGNGQIYCWQEGKLVRVVDAHEGPCFAMIRNNQDFFTAGKDSKVIQWDAKFESQISTREISPGLVKPGALVQEKSVLRSITVNKDWIAAGTKSGELLFLNKNDSSAKIINQGHCQGEVWGLATHPSKYECATLSDDEFLRIWDYSGGNMALKKLKKVGKPGRSVAYAPDGSIISLGFNDGSFKLLKTDDLSEVNSMHDRKEQISDMKFSPDGKHVAVGSNDNFVDIYETHSGKKSGVCKGSSSYITHVDWSVGGDLLQTNSGAREQLFYEMPSGNRKIISPVAAEKEFAWHSWTGVLGECVQGAWPPKSDVTDINATCRHPEKPYLATADDFGFVKLFNFPCPGKYAKFKSYLGHSAHVTNVRWSHDGMKLLSLGGADTSLMVWSLEGSGSGKSDASDSGDSDGE